MTTTEQEYKSHDNSGRDATQEDVKYFHDLEIKF